VKHLDPCGLFSKAFRRLLDPLGISVANYNEFLQLSVNMKEGAKAFGQISTHKEKKWQAEPTGCQRKLQES